MSSGTHLVLHPPAEAVAPKSALRLAYLDMTKGWLVMLMIVYHAFNYTSQYYLSFRYLSFLPPSFIFITGYLLAAVYLPKFAGSPKDVSKRLWVRGGKLLAVFTTLNILAQFVRSPHYGESVGVGVFFSRWDDVYLHGSGRIAAFDVLLPIAYLLLLAPALLWMAQRGRNIFTLIATAMIGLGLVSEQVGVSMGHLYLVNAGLLGMVVGQWLPRLSAIADLLWVVILAYLVYGWLAFSHGHRHVFQLLGAFVAISLLCGISVRLEPLKKISSWLILLGQYSLLGYVAQIGFLQVLSRFFGRPAPLSVETAILLVGTFAFTLGIVAFTQWARSHFRAVDGLYRGVFA
jgi:hypothetical protein